MRNRTWQQLDAGRQAQLRSHVGRHPERAASWVARICGVTEGTVRAVRAGLLTIGGKR
jgi:hypothetical protein